MLFSFFLFGMVSIQLVGMDDISRLAALYQKIDPMGYGIVDNGPDGVTTSFLGMMVSVRKKAEMKAKARENALQDIKDAQLREKRAQDIENNKEDYTPEEVRSPSFFLHVTIEAEKDRIALPVKQQIQISPISVNNGISSPKGILKKSKKSL